MTLPPDLVTDDLHVQATYYFEVLDENGKSIDPDQFLDVYPVLTFRFPPQQIQIQRSIRAEIMRDIGAGYSISSGGEGIGKIHINATHGVGQFVNANQTSTGLAYRNQFAAFFNAFCVINDKRGKLGQKLLQMQFTTEGGGFSNQQSETYYVWPESFPADLRNSSKPHAWDWTIVLNILAQQTASATIIDNSTVIDPNTAITQLTASSNNLNQQLSIFKKFKNIVQGIKNTISIINSINKAISTFVNGAKDFVYSVSGLIRQASQSVKALLKTINVNDFMSDVQSAFRSALYDLRSTLGMVQITAIQFDRVGTLAASLTPPQTSSPIRPVVVSLNPADTLASIANRILGDSSQWPQLVSINNLDYPYIDFSGVNGTPDPSYAAQGLNVVGAGYQMKIPLPAAQGTVPIAIDPFGTDLQDSQSLIAPVPPSTTPTAPGEALVGGLINLAAATIRRLLTPVGHIPWHPDYGSLLPKLVGSPTTLANVQLLQNEVTRCLSLDPRIISIQDVLVSFPTTSNNSIQITPTVITPLGPLKVPLQLPVVA